MRTVIETPTFQKQAEAIWPEDERLEFIYWIAVNPDAGDVIQGAEGARKVRWKKSGTGKSGGVRVIYYHLVDDEVVLLIMVYEKSKKSTVSAKDVKHARR